MPTLGELLEQSERLLVLLLCAVWTAAVVQFLFPPGTQASGWTVWGVGYDAWCIIHSVSLAVLVIMVLVHLILHWTWVCGLIASRLGRKGKMLDGVKTMYGVSTLVVVLTVLGLLLAAAQFATNSPTPK